MCNITEFRNASDRDLLVLKKRSFAYFSFAYPAEEYGKNQYLIDSRKNKLNSKIVFPHDENFLLNVISWEVIENWK